MHSVFFGILLLLHNKNAVCKAETNQESFGHFSAFNLDNHVACHISVCSI